MVLSIGPFSHAGVTAESRQRHRSVTEAFFLEKFEDEYWDVGYGIWDEGLGIAELISRQRAAGSRQGDS